MYTDHFGTLEYPFVATFYHLDVDDSLPLNQQKEEKVVTFQSVCDVDDNNNGLNNDTITLYIPFDPTYNTIGIFLGELMEVETYGIIQKGTVSGIRPSQLGGVKVMCKRT